eukprot:Opistho-2@90958
MQRTMAATKTSGARMSLTRRAEWRRRITMTTGTGSVTVSPCVNASRFGSASARMCASETTGRQTRTPPPVTTHVTHGAPPVRPSMPPRPAPLILTAVRPRMTSQLTDTNPRPCRRRALRKGTRVAAMRTLVVTLTRHVLLFTLTAAARMSSARRLLIMGGRRRRRMTLARITAAMNRPKQRRRMGLQANLNLALRRMDTATEARTHRLRRHRHPMAASMNIANTIHGQVEHTSMRARGLRRLCTCHRTVDRRTDMHGHQVHNEGATLIAPVCMSDRLPAMSSAQPALAVGRHSAPGEGRGGSHGTSA